MKILASKLIGLALEHAVSQCEGATEGYKQNVVFLWNGRPVITVCGHDVSFNPSVSWMHGGPIIDREGILNGPSPFPGGEFAAGIGSEWSNCKHISLGPTPLIAAMRCFVASKMGDEIEIPDECC